MRTLTNTRVKEVTNTFYQRCSMEAQLFKLLISWLICAKFHSLLMLFMLLMLFTVLNHSLGDMSSLKKTPCKCKDFLTIQRNFLNANIFLIMSESIPNMQINAETTRVQHPTEHSLGHCPTLRNSICKMKILKISLILPVVDHNITKNLKGHRMHVEGPQIYQMNRHINSFQNFNLGRDSEDGI